MQIRAIAPKDKTTSHRANRGSILLDDDKNYADNAGGIIENYQSA